VLWRAARRVDAARAAMCRDRQHAPSLRVRRSQSVPKLFRGRYAGVTKRTWFPGIHV
jgi:hypothetical protein